MPIRQIAREVAEVVRIFFLSVSTLEQEKTQSPDFAMANPVRAAYKSKAICNNLLSFKLHPTYSIE